MKVYETDFGFGRPRKSDLVLLGETGSLNFSDSRDEKMGGIEFGVVLSMSEMDTFELQLKMIDDVIGASAMLEQ
ncbi:Coumaroyl-CoA:anthocyanidin 3-O-glucoside-6''-O-coumaroyltransferase 2 [Linum perenne]